MITTKSLVNIRHLRTPFLKGEHFPSVCILNTSHEILNHFLCMNSAARLKNQEQKPEARFPLKISWFSRAVHSLSPHLSITQKIVALKGKRVEGWWAPYFSQRHPTGDAISLRSSPGQKRWAEIAQPGVLSGRGPQMGLTLHVLWTDDQGHWPFVPALVFLLSSSTCLLGPCPPPLYLVLHCLGRWS